MGRRWTRLSGPVYERRDGLRIHLGGHIAVPDGGRWRFVWSAYRMSDWVGSEWKRAMLMEPKPRRAMMLMADTCWPEPVDTEACVQRGQALRRAERQGEVRITGRSEPTVGYQAPEGGHDEPT